MFVTLCKYVFMITLSDLTDCEMAMIESDDEELFGCRHIVCNLGKGITITVYEVFHCTDCGMERFGSYESPKARSLFILAN